MFNVYMHFQDYHGQYNCFDFVFYLSPVAIYKQSLYCMVTYLYAIGQMFALNAISTIKLQHHRLTEKFKLRKPTTLCS